MMELNTADGLQLGSLNVSKVYLGDTAIWTRQWTHGLSLPGAKTDYASTPSMAGGFTNGLDIRIKLKPASWTAGNWYLYQQSGTWVELAWNAQLKVGWSPGSTFLTATSSVIVPFSDGAAGWVRVTTESDGGTGTLVKFWTRSGDTDAWTQLGTTQTVADSYQSRTTAAVQYLGRDTDGANVHAGVIYYAEWRNGVDGTILDDFDPSKVTPTDLRTPNTYTDTAGTVWTVNGSAWQWLQPPSSTPQTYFVDSVNGVDTADGTSDTTPWATLGRVSAANPQPGDTVKIALGSSFSATRLFWSGLSGKPVTIETYGTGAAPLFTGNTTYGAIELHGNWVTLDGVETTGATGQPPRGGVVVYGEDCIVQNCESYGNTAGFVQAPTGARVQFLSCNSHDNVEWVGSGSDDDAGANGFVLLGDGAKILHPITSGNHAASPDYGTDGSAFETYNATNVEIGWGTCTDEWEMFEAGKDSGKTSSNIHIHDTLFAQDSSLTGATGWWVHGDDNFGPVTDVLIENCTIVLSETDGHAFGNQMGAGVTVRNNIIIASDDTSDGGITDESNVYVGFTPSFDLGTGSIEVTDVAAMNFADSATGDYTLTSESPAVDIGVDVTSTEDLAGNPRKSGTAVDAGCYELQS